MAILELEQPAWTVDPVILDTSTDNPVLINRDPEPDEVQIDAGTLIALEISDTTGGTITLASTDIYVEGVLAFSAGVFQPGFTGPDSAFSTPFAHTLRVVIDPVALFDSEQVVSVRVVSLTSGLDAIDVTYDFTVEDLTAPKVTGADSRAQKVVRVAFDEAMTQAEVLNPANWTITRLSVPAVNVVVVSVEPVSSTAVDLLLDIPITPVATYRVTAANVTDIHGNVVDPSFDSALFLGFQPPKPGRRNLSFWRLMPGFYREEDAAGTGDLRKLTGCWDEVLNLVLYEVDRFFDEIDPDTAQEYYVDLMLRDLGNPFAEAFALSLTQKRKLVETLVLIYQKKGTPSGLIDAIRFFIGVETDVVLFRNTGLRLGSARLGSRNPPPPATGTFRLNMGSRAARYSFDVVSQVVLTDSQREQIRTLAEYMKPGWTHLIHILEPIFVPGAPHGMRLGRSRLSTNWYLNG